MPDITIQGTLNINNGGVTASGSKTNTATLDVSAKKTAVTQALATALADLNVGAITWAEITALFLVNLSVTTGEDMTITKRIGIGSLSLQGTVAGASVPATAAGGAGFYYEITSAGTSQGKTWAVGDWAIYSGTSGTWFQITPNVELAVIKPGESFGPIRPRADGTVMRAKAATGTPTVEIVAAGPTV